MTLFLRLLNKRAVLPLALLPFSIFAQPTITGVTPASNERAAPVGTSVSATFSQSLVSGSESSLQLFSNQRGGKRTANSGTTSLVGNTLTFAPSYNFKPGETVSATVTTAARSASGSLAVPRVYQFTAAATGGNGTFTSGADVPVGSNPYIVLTADIDGDGDLDLLTPNFTGNSVSIRLNNGAGVFSGTTNTPVGTQPRGLALSDIDGDGDLDIITANYDDNTASVRFNNGSGVFSGNLELTVGSQPQSVMTADLDGDGDQDLLVSNGASSTVSILINNGNGAFSNNPSVAVGSFPFSLTTADIDNDGDIDLLTGSYQSTTVSIRLNNGTGTFSGTTNLTAGSQPRGVTTADIDADGDLDLLVANANSNNVNVFVNNGSGGFTLSATLTVGNFPGGITAADIDGDGDFDLLIPNIFDNTVSVKLNNGLGVFTSGANVSVGSQPYRVAMSDIDNDGDLDMLVANFAGNNVSVRFNYVLPDLVVSTPQNVSGTYRNVTVTGPATGGAGTGTLTGSLTVVGTLTIQNGGTLLTACQPLVGTGNFVLEAGGTLGICDPAGIAPTGSTGAVRLTGTRSFSNDASYIYNGTAAQVTGPALPSQVRNLTTTNANGVTLSGPETVMQVLTVGGAGNLVLNGQMLTLPSAATGTALVVNSGTGTVQGATALVQRYIDPAGNAGPGYRHYSAPVAATTVADLTTSGFSPVLNAAYNTSARPDLVTPFPTVYGYDQSRLATTTNNSSAFDKGWASPSGTGDALAVGLGYTVNIAASEKVDFTGTLNNGDRTVPLARNSGATATDAGWALVGNPYPAPLDWDQVAAIDRSNLDGAMYVFESSSQYNGTYRAYTNGVGGGNPLIGSSQGFFVRVSAGQTAGSLTFRNNQRVTSYGRQAPFRRGTTDTRPLVQLQLKGATGPADALFVYAESGATAGLDSQFDAVKLPNSTGLNLTSVSTTTPALAIDGRDQFTTATAIPLSIGVPAVGTYTLDAEQLFNLPANLTAYLFDAQANQVIDLSQRPSYTFAVTAQQAMQAQTSRFQLRFGPAAGPLATRSAKAGVEVILYPNPAHSSFTVTVPTNATGTAAGRATLFNSLGQAVRENISLSAAGAATTIDVANLAQGVYTLRVLVGVTSIAKQIVVQ
jgi:hypothetical protein